MCKSHPEKYKQLETLRQLEAVQRRSVDPGEVQRRSVKNEEVQRRSVQLEVVRQRSVNQSEVQRRSVKKKKVRRRSRQFEDVRCSQVQRNLKCAQWSSGALQAVCRRSKQRIGMISVLVSRRSNSAEHSAIQSRIAKR